MSIFKCKMCGGSLEITNETVAVCEYCGTKQTLPKLDNDRRANLYDRANHFRRNNDFDKAMGIYEQILNEDNTDAEAYWSLVLCRYGIEYVEDPASRKRIPTVNRAQFTSIFADENYKSALQCADPYQRAVYEDEAKAIDEIQKGILAISQKEEPFDIFICYKETDQSGRRTPDSVLANDLYHQLTQEGFKVFFSRITLEDKLGTAYEPYIFAALNSAKVMVVLGTRPEYFNAVWVKNEWSRYLALIKSDAKKILIPAYRDMDPYDLPEEFSHLQAQDMSKLGFMQDLIRGIKKITHVDEPKATTVIKETVVNAAASNTTPLLKRAFMFLEDGDWQSANEYCEKVLDLEPENAEAYLGKLMAEFRARKQEELKEALVPFDSSNNYKKALRFGSTELTTALKGYITHINTRNEIALKEKIYSDAVNAMASAKTESVFKEIAQQFEVISGYKDADALAARCIECAEIVRKDTLLADAKSKMHGERIANYKEAFEILTSLRGWKDVDEQIAACEKKIAELNTKAELAHRQAQRRKKRAKRTAIIVTPIVGVITVFIIVSILLNAVIIPNGKYNDAIALMEARKYAEAISAFEALNGYKDSVNKIDECNTAILEIKYNDAIALMNTENLDEAYSIFIALGDYKDAAGKASDIILAQTKKQLKNSIKVGNYIKFGTYEQDNNTSNGQEDIEWLVLETKGEKALIISKYALEYEPYHTEYTDVTWETCSLRYWLNYDFIYTAFSPDEKAMIPTVTVSADKNPAYSTDPGEATQDQVFLLSIIEANKYFSSDSARKCKPTNYAVANDDWEYNEVYCWWWLRSPGADQKLAAGAYSDGINDHGNAVDKVNRAVRPAMWIDLSN